MTEVSCNICINKLIEAKDKVVCIQCFTFICKECYDQLDQKQCALCRFKYRIAGETNNNSPDGLTSNMVTDLLHLQNLYVEVF